MPVIIRNIISTQDIDKSYENTGYRVNIAN